MTLRALFTVAVGLGLGLILGQRLPDIGWWHELVLVGLIGAWMTTRYLRKAQ